MNKWFYFNFCLFLVGIWNISQHDSFPTLHVWIGFLALVLFLSNWTRHAMFSTLRSSIDRKRKIKYANMSKRILPFHKWIGTTALLVVIIHFIFIMRVFSFQLTNLKMMSGLIALVALSLMALSGWLRLYWPTPFKRMTHLRVGLSLFFLILAHLLL